MKSYLTVGEVTSLAFDAYRRGAQPARVLRKRMVLLVPMAFIAVGVWLVVSGVLAVRLPREPEIPAAKLEDWQPFPEPAPGKIRLGKVIGGTLLMAFGGFLIPALYWLGDAFTFKFGRPLRVHGRQRLARRARGAGSHDDARPCLDRLGAWRRARLGERWLAAARAEQASVPAFEQLAAQLTAARAPAALVERCHAAAHDEARHARRCYALARAYSGIDWAAGSLPVADDSAVALPALATESLLDGCVGEGIAADFARAGAERADDPAVRASLAMIAEDEAAHAELAWAVVAFCLERGGAAVGRAITSQVRCARVPSAGPIELARAERRQIAEARIARVRERLAALIESTTPIPARSI